MTKTALGLTAVMVAGILTMGPAATKPAEANDTGRIIAGLAAGAIVYGLLGDNNRSNRHARSNQRGYYNGNSGTWDCRPPQRRPQPRHQTRRPPQRRESPRQTYNRGYDTGYNRGYSTGWNNGANYGYSRGYDNGYSDGGGWNNWGYNGGGRY